MTSIYATTISSENFIIINNKTIELSGNIFMKKDVTINNGLLTTNSLIPNVTNSASLGSTSNSWSNAYIRDVSATNIELSGNIVPLNANGSILGSSLKLWSNAYINDVSVSNIELSGNIVPLNVYSSRLGSSVKPWSNAYINDISVSNIELSGNIVPLNANKSNLGSSLKPWSNAYISDVSATNIELSGNIVPLNANKSSLGSGLKLWSNAYINDVSATNIELSGNIVPLNTNSSTLGSALKPWNNAYMRDVSVTNIELSGNIVPLNVNSSILGSSLKPWSNAYINDVSATNIDISGKLNVTGAVKISNSLEISGNVTFGGSTLYVPASFTIVPVLAPSPIELIVIGEGPYRSNPQGNDNNTGTLTINGNLVVQGEITSINSSVVDISDKMIVLASNASNAIQANGAGFEISGAKVNFLYNNSSATFNSSIGISISGNVLPLAVGSIGEAGKVWNNAYIRDVSVTNIELSGNIVPLNANRSTLGSTLKHWSNAYISDVSVTNIELSGNIVPLNANSSILGSALKTWSNAYIRDVSATNIELSGNIVPLNANKSNLGSALKPWSNAYISDVSVTNIELSGNMVPLNANSSNLGSVLKTWSNAYISDVSITNIELSGNIVPLNANSSRLGSALKHWSNAYISDVSATNIELSGNIVPLNANRSNLGSALKYWSNAYIRDVSVSNIELSGNIVPLNANRSNLGSSFKLWSNVYMRDISVTNIELSGNIVPLNANSSRLGSSLKRWNNIFVNDLSVNTINGQVYGAGGGGGTVDISSVSSNIVPSITNTYSLGSTTKYWSNAYIRDISVSNRVYQEISGDISWSAVNGYYGLAKDAYPALNPLSSGVKAVQTWSSRVSALSYLAGCCWSPELGIFVCVQNERSGGIIISPNGINWTLAQTYPSSTRWSYICWSPQLKLFVATATAAPNGRNIATSTDGNIWTLVPISSEIPYYITDICWSAELGMFVAVTEQSVIITSINGYDWIRRGSSNPEFGKCCWSAELNIFVVTTYYGNNMRISKNGIDWITITINTLDVNTWIQKICWSSNLGIFVIVSRNGPHRVATSIDGINWIPRTQGVELISWTSVCWSPQLVLFIAISEEGSIMTSPNGIIWKLYLSGLPRTNICWSPELGIFVVVGGAGTDRVMTSSLKCRPPTSYNVFDGSFNSIDETGKWTFANVAVSGTITAGGAGAAVTSDDRLKHNEVIINNGLAVIDKLCPKFYQKTQVMLDASYNGDLSGYAWNYEAGLIAQEVLQTGEINFVVSGGDYYESVMNYDLSVNDLSVNNLSVNDLSVNEVSNNLIKKPYALNYNSIFTYGVAAIKELHTKVKAQEANILDQQLNSLITRIETLETQASIPNNEA